MTPRDVEHKAAEATTVAPLATRMRHPRVSGGHSPRPAEALALATLPASAFGDRRIHHADLAVLGVVSWFARGKATCRPSDAEISAETATILPKGVARSLGRLAKAGYLRIELDPDGRSIVLPWLAASSSV